MTWTAENIPDQHGKLVVVTGANSGIGFEAARALAGKGAHVILIVRSAEKGRASVGRILREYANAQVEAMELDLADLSSVRNFAAQFLQQYNTLPLLINNAGVMAIPYRQTVDGFEMQFATNHLGHFALTGLLLPAILAASGARVVTVSSSLHSSGAINFDDLNGVKAYRPWDAYGQSKLANLLFAYELQRRFTASGSDAISIGCHPGWAATNLQFVGARMENARWRERFAEVLNQLFAQSAAMGALPTLYAGIADDVNGCDYIGPTSFFGSRGYPGKVPSSARSYDENLARQLWEVSEKLTGVSYQTLAPPTPV
jgi:NAD(P)-dependent dehydrogenase (short-subunit alcohol dehydrogenase family)